MFFRKQINISKIKDTKKLEKLLLKFKKELEEKRSKVDVLLAKMDKLVSESANCNKAASEASGKGDYKLSSKISAKKMEINKEHLYVQKDYIAMNDKVKFLEIKVRKIEGILNNSSENSNDDCESNVG